MLKIKRYAVIAELEDGTCHQVLIKDSDQDFLRSVFAHMFPDKIQLVEEPLSLTLEDAKEYFNQGEKDESK